VFHEFVRAYIEIRFTETPFDLIVSRNWSFADLMEDLHTMVVGAMSNPLFTRPLTNKPLRQDQIMNAMDVIAVVPASRASPVSNASL
jgi:hypothetical protein